MMNIENLFSLQGRSALVTGGSRAGDYVVGSTLVVDGGVAWAR